MSAAFAFTDCDNSMAIQPAPQFSVVAGSVLKSAFELRTAEDVSQRNGEQTPTNLV